jgi:hypothetical protein
MRIISRLISTVALATTVAAGSALLSYTTAASAGTVTADFSGLFTNGDSYSGDITLTVVDGQATSGSGVFTGLGLTAVPIVLITTSTSGNETAGGPSYPVGFRANDGTDLFGADTVYPPDTAGLLFDVGTSSAAWGSFPLFNLAAGANNSMFDGKVNGTEYYVLLGSSTITPTPLPSTWLMLLSGLLGFGFFAYRGTTKTSDCCHSRLTGRTNRISEKTAARRSFLLFQERHGGESRHPSAVRIVIWPHALAGQALIM